MSRTDRQLARLLRAEEPPEPPPELLETLRRDIPHLPPAPRYPQGKVEELHPRPFLGWMAAAASVVIALGASMLALRMAHQASPPGEAAAVAPHILAAAPEAPAAEAGGAAPREESARGVLAPGADAFEDAEGGERDAASFAPRPASPAPPPPRRAAPSPRELDGIAAGPEEFGVASDQDTGAAAPADGAVESRLMDEQRRQRAASVGPEELAQVPAAPPPASRRGLAPRLESSEAAERSEDAEAGRRDAAGPAGAVGRARAPQAAPAEVAAAAPGGVAGGVAAEPAPPPAVADPAPQAPPAVAEPAPRSAERAARLTAPREAGLLGDASRRGGFVATEEDRLSSFALATGGSSFAALRAHLDAGRLPPREAVRTAELVRGMPYRGPAPTTVDLAIGAEGAASPWAQGPRRHLLRVAVRARAPRAGEDAAAIVADAARAQVELDPRWVARWRLVGDDAAPLPDARFRTAAPSGGVLAVGDLVTVLYELELRPRVPSSARLALVRVRWRPPGADAEVESERPVLASELAAGWEAASRDLRLAAVTGRFGEILAGKTRAADADLADLARRAEALAAESPDEPLLRELARLAARARDLRGGER